MKEYVRKLEIIGGRMVIFDNPKGIYNTDNTTNFLTVLAKGLMALYYDLKRDGDTIHLHFASRRNNTRQDNPEELPVSPTRVLEPGYSDDGVILALQYKAQIRNLAFLQGGQWLLDDKGFSSMLDGMEILKDIYVKTPSGKKERQANPFTVPCDYICNTLLNEASMGKEHLAEVEDLYHSPACMFYETEKPLLTSVNSLPSWEDGQDNGSTLFSLISLDFPEPAVSAFFRGFNAASADTQKTAVQYVVRALFEKVDCQKAMPQLADRLGHTIEMAGRIQNAEIRNEFIANLLLYQKSLFTHLGDRQKMESITAAFRKTVDEIQDDSARDELMCLADNRRLVDLTDGFDYDTAMREFEEIERYWKEMIHLRHRRLSGTRENPRYPAYGKTIGSFLQVLRHLIHQSPLEEKELYDAEAAERYEAGRYHLLETNDIIRYHETVSDIEAEMGRFQSAFDHLYQAAVLEEDPGVEGRKDIPISGKNGMTIIESAGTAGEKHPYLMQHFVRLISQMLISDRNSPEAETLAKVLLPFVSPDFGEKIYTPHPRTQIQWKTASILASCPRLGTQEKQLAAHLFKKAAEALLRQGKPVFSAIAVGVLAEHLWHIRLGHMPGNAAVVCKSIKKAYHSFIDLKTDSEKNPFLGLLPNDPEQVPDDIPAQVSHDLFCRIGY